MISIRSVHPDDLDEVKELMRRESNSLGFLAPPSLEYYAQTGGIHAVMHGSVPIGFIVFAKSRMTHPRESHIYQVMIEREHRRHGHASWLVRFAEMVCRSAGSLRMTCHVRDDLTTALAFWKERGYNVTGTKPGGRARGRLILCHVKELC